MMGTFNCVYETPCGWCSKWDKKCDRSIGCGKSTHKRGLRANAGLYEEACDIDVRDLFKEPWRSNIP
jgi:hypothetical protein